MLVGSRIGDFFNVLNDNFQMDHVVKKVVLVGFTVNEVDTRQWWRWLCGRYDGGGDWSTKAGEQ